VTALVESSEGDVNAGPARDAYQAAYLDRPTRDLLAADAAVFLHQSLSTPCLNVISHASGSTIEDMGGRRFLDFHANAVNQVGFANPRVLDAIRAQMDVLVYAPRRYTNETAVALAQCLTELAPGDLSRVLFTTSGATAISAAVQLARVATGRHKTISLWDSFHGATLDTISLGGEPSFRAGIGPLMPGAGLVPPPDPWRCPLGCRARSGACDLTCADYLEYVLEHEGDVAAVVAETVRSTPVIPPMDYWKAVRAACDRHGVLLILDEIPNGLGRTGSLFSCDSFGVLPDILVLGKGLGGGVMPLAAVVAREGLNIAGARSIGHFTHEKNPVSCAAGLAVLAELTERDLPGRARTMGAAALSRLQSIAAAQPLVGEVRGIGLLMGVVMARHRDGRAASDVAEAVMYAALARGLSFKVTMGDVLQLTPPLTVTDDEMERALAILEESLTEVASHWPDTGGATIAH